MTPTPKTPTASGISRLLKSAGHTPAVRQMRGGCSGFVVTQDRARAGQVRVRHYFWSMGAYSRLQEQKLAAYAKTITEAGWTVEAGTYELIVTAKERGLTDA